MIAPRDRAVASLRRRAVAAIVDLLVLLTGFAACVWTAVKLGTRRRRDPVDPASSRHHRPKWKARVTAVTESRRARIAVRGLSVTCLGVPQRNWQSPGARLAGIQRVDARTRGPVTVRSVVLDEIAGAAFGLLTTPLTSRLRRRSDAEQARVQELAPQVRELQRRYAGDPDTQQQAITDFYRANNVNPANSLVWLLPGTLLMPLTALLSTRRQTLCQRIAGTLVIRTR